jgi:hypothetical protein
MAKHVLNPIDQLQVPLIRSMQEALAKMPAHARYTPQHSAGIYSTAEWEEQINYGIAGFNARQSAFYEKNDRTEGARPDDDWEFFDGYYSDGDEEEED